MVDLEGFRGYLYEYKYPNIAKTLESRYVRAGILSV